MIKVTLGDKTFALENKKTIKDLIPEDKQKDYFVAKVNNRLRELTYELSFDSKVELLNNTSSDSVKVYETSLRYLIAMAFHNLYPNYQIRISYNISRSLLVSILSPNNIIFDSKMLVSIKEEMNRLVSLDLPFVRKTISKEEAHNHYIKHNQLDKDSILKYRPEKNCHVYVCGNYENYMYGYMVPSTGYLRQYKLFSYDNQLVVQYPRYESNGQIPEFKDEPTFSKELKKSHAWAKICNAEIVSKMNDHVTEETYVDFINMCETHHNDMLAKLGEKIVEDINKQIIARISTINGIVEPNDLSGFPVYISLKEINRGEMPVNEKGETLNFPKGGIAYTIPGQAKVTVSAQGKEFANNVVDLAQLGIVYGMAPSNFTDKKAPVYLLFDPATGAAAEVGPVSK